MSTTINDVAKEAGVSVATVSNVLNDTRYVSPELKEDVKAAIDKLGYQPDITARSLTTNKTEAIGLVVSDISNPFFSTLVRGVEDQAVDEEHSLVVCNTDESSDKEELYINTLVQRKIDGVIISPVIQRESRLEALRKASIPLVFVDRKASGVKADAVLSDNQDGAFQATDYLIKQGHKNIGIILGLQTDSTTQERLDGYKKALNVHNLPFNQEFVERGDSKIQGGTKAIKSLLHKEKRPTAVFITNNLMTIGALKYLKKSKLSCPEDISFVGFDDFEWATLLDPPLTTVAQSPYQMGVTASRLLMERMEGDGLQSFKEKRLPNQLIIRESVKGISSSNNRYQ